MGCDDVNLGGGATAIPGSIVGDTIDLCPAHARLVAQEGWSK